MKINEQKLKEEIITLAKRRGPDKTICPSEAARAVDSDNWRTLMEDIRDAAQSLQEKGFITVEQNGEPVDLNEVSGPVRLRINPGQSA